MQQLPPLPPHLLVQLGGYEAREETLGRSDAAVFRLYALNRPPLIAKLSASTKALDLLAEAARLKWLKGVGILAPRVLHLAEADGYFWLVVECLPGEDAARSRAPPAVKTSELAKALRAIHALDPNACPFDETLTVKLARAADRAKSNNVNEGDFDDENQGKTAAELFGEVERLRPTTEDIVVVHGDACLPNMMLDSGQFSGFVDCGRLGRSDRYQDLALACRSIAMNLGSEWVGAFLRAYGMTSIDEGRIRFYRLVDEFF
jgi:aminoglycoside 3'-phosphotransferase II